MRRKFQNDPDILHWLDSAPGQQWLNSKHHGFAQGYFFATMKEQNGVWCTPFSWRWSGDDHMLRVCTLEEGRESMYVTQMSPEGNNHP